MQDWDIAPTVKIGKHVQYLDLLEKTVNKHGREFYKGDLIGSSSSWFPVHAFNYCLDQGFLNHKGGNIASYVMTLTAEGERALVDLKKYRIKRRIELLQKKKIKIEKEIALLKKG